MAMHDGSRQLDRGPRHSSIPGPRLDSAVGSGRTRCVLYAMRAARCVSEQQLGSRGHTHDTNSNQNSAPEWVQEGGARVHADMTVTEP